MYVPLEVSTSVATTVAVLGDEAGKSWMVKLEGSVETDWGGCQRGDERQRGPSRD